MNLYICSATGRQTPLLVAAPNTQGAIELCRHDSVYQSWDAFQIQGVEVPGEARILPIQAPASVVFDPGKPMPPLVNIEELRVAFDNLAMFNSMGYELLRKDLALEWLERIVKSYERERQTLRQRIDSSEERIIQLMDIASSLKAERDTERQSNMHRLIKSNHLLAARVETFFRYLENQVEDGEEKVGGEPEQPYKNDFVEYISNTPWPDNATHVVRDSAGGCIWFEAEPTLDGRYPFGWEGRIVKRYYNPATPFTGVNWKLSLRKRPEALSSE